MLSEQDAPNTVPGLFSLQIMNAAKVGSMVYLNTEYDYRDRHNVSVVLTPAALKQFATQYPDQQPELYFLGRSIVVNGVASRQTIWFYADGKKTESTTSKPIFRFGLPVRSCHH